MHYIISCRIYCLLLPFHKTLEKQKRLLPYHDTSNELKEINVNNTV